MFEVHVGQEDERVSLLGTQERNRIDRITAAVHCLLKGGVPERLDVDGQPDDELRQLAGKVNALAESVRQVQDAITPLSQGNLTYMFPTRNALASPFKQLQAKLRHLTWQTQQIAQGDFSQRVDFMGEFSQGFNSMVIALDKARSELKAINEELEDRIAQQVIRLQQSTLLERYLPPRLVEAVTSGKQKVDAGQEQCQITILSVDFTDPDETIGHVLEESIPEVLSGLMAALSRVTFDHGGTLFEKSVSHGLRVLYGAPFSEGDIEDAKRCVRLALDMQSEATQLKIQWQERGIPTRLSLSMGVSSGRAIVGNFGSERSVDYSAVGPCVMASTRLAHAAGGGEILISEATRELIGNVALLERRAMVTLSTTGTPEPSYAVFELDQPAKPHESEDLELSEVTGGQDSGGILEDLEADGRTIHIDSSFDRTSRAAAEIVLRAGSLVDGRYQIQREIGRGGMGVVYLANHIGMNVERALKVILPRVLARPGGLESFQREAQVTVRLQHPNIIRLYDFARSYDGFYYLVLEYVDGEPLSETMENKQLRFGETEIREIAVSLLRALETAHGLGIIHRDLKPQNILMANNVPKILDFGLAQAAHEIETAIGATSDDVRPMTIGTPVYMSPEQWENRPLSYASDLYSLGILMYEMRSGHRPFRVESLKDYRKSVLNSTPIPLQEEAPNASPAFCEFVHRVIETDPNRRFQTAKEMKEALLALELTPDGSDPKTPPSK